MDVKDARIRQLELECQALRNSLKATREAKVATSEITSGQGGRACKTCDGLRKLLASATKVLEERERHSAVLERRIDELSVQTAHTPANQQQPWPCDVCGQLNLHGQPDCINKNCGSPVRRDSPRMQSGYFPSPSRHHEGFRTAPMERETQEVEREEQVQQEEDRRVHDTDAHLLSFLPSGTPRKEAIRVVQCGWCRHVLTAASGSVAVCPNCSMEIAVPHLKD